MLAGHICRTYVNNPAPTAAGQVGIEHAHILLQLLVGVATEGLATLDQHSLVELVVETHYGEPVTMSERRHLRRGEGEEREGGYGERRASSER